MDEGKAEGADETQELPESWGLDEPDLTQEAFDKDKNLAILNRSLPPRGTYTTHPEEFGDFSKVYAAFEDDQGPRRMYILSGRVSGNFKEKTTGEIKAVTTFVRLRVSPDERKAKVFGEDGKPTGDVLEKNDSPTRRWAEAARAYEQTYQEPPKHQQAILDFLMTQSYKLVLTQFKGELFVQQVRSLRGR